MEHTLCISWCWFGALGFQGLLPRADRVPQHPTAMSMRLFPMTLGITPAPSSRVARCWFGVAGPAGAGTVGTRLLYVPHIAQAQEPHSSCSGTSSASKLLRRERW